jgi:hypothetical protein
MGVTPQRGKSWGGFPMPSLDPGEMEKQEWDKEAPHHYPAKSNEPEERSSLAETTVENPPRRR